MIRLRALPVLLGLLVLAATLPVASANILPCPPPGDPELAFVCETANEVAEEYGLDDMFAGFYDELMCTVHVVPNVGYC